MSLLMVGYCYHTYWPNCSTNPNKICHPTPLVSGLTSWPRVHSWNHNLETLKEHMQSVHLYKLHVLELSPIKLDYCFKWKMSHIHSSVHRLFISACTSCCCSYVASYSTYCLRYQNLIWGTKLSNCHTLRCCDLSFRLGHGLGHHCKHWDTP